jgi:hypothetical protein
MGVALRYDGLHRLQLSGVPRPEDRRSIRRGDRPVQLERANRALTPTNGILFINLVPVTTFLISILAGYNMSKLEVVGAAVTIAALVSTTSTSGRFSEPGARSPRRFGPSAAWWSRSAVEPSITPGPVEEVRRQGLAAGV